MNLALQPPRWPFTIEKWYIDTLMEDGTVFLLYLGQMSLFGVRWARLTAELFQPDQPAIQGHASASGLKGEEDRLSCKAATLDGNNLRFETPNLKGELQFTPLHGPMTLHDPLLQSKDKRLTWAIEIPDAEVTGRLIWDGGELEVKGRGYRDRVRSELLPWAFPIFTLRWGRAAAGPNAVTWLRADTRDGIIVTGWKNGQRCDTAFDSVGIEDTEPFLDSKIVELQGLASKWMRPMLRRVSGDPHEVKYRATASLSGHTGRAVHEIVHWGRGAT
ncbi:MAG: hypothetical protein HN348_30840 [Proteobacteria bacterium]|nr:hypothetical protein [Pseudomonadota bacterium]